VEKYFKMTHNHSNAQKKKEKPCKQKKCWHRGSNQNSRGSKSKPCIKGKIPNLPLNKEFRCKVAVNGDYKKNC